MHEEKYAIGQTRIIHASDRSKNGGFCNNRISNTKYTVINFIPKNLREQFSLHMNKYFLLIGLLQLISVISPVSPITTLGPMVIIFSLSAIKELLDDRRRAQQDKIANETQVEVMQQGASVHTPSQDVEVGDILIIKEDEDVPCDLVLLASSNQGFCYVQTTNLDGETNLKPRSALEITQNLGLEQVRNFHGVVECDPPNHHIEAFDSRLWIQHSMAAQPPNFPPVALSAYNFLQQGTRLRNTKWICGLAVYTGNETKFGKNKTVPGLKRTEVDKFTDRLSVIIFFFQLILVIMLGTLGELMRRRDLDVSYLRFLSSEDGGDEFVQVLIMLARFLLLNSTFIPISLKFSLDICKLLYAHFINRDNSMYCPETGGRAIARNTAISEQLGQIKFVLTDKTGTLTRNQMVFHECAVRNAHFTPVQIKEGELRSAVDAKDPEVMSFLRNLALNNSIVPPETADAPYKGSSPDEVSLVQAAADAGVRLIERERSKVAIKFNGNTEEYEVLQELEFTSDRKRMSVVLKNCATGSIKLYTKGADDALMSLMATDEDNASMLRDVAGQLDRAAETGLRTLLFAERAMEEAEFKSWKALFLEAETAVKDREGLKAESYKLLEQNLRCTGYTAIEDKLQEEVPETIEKLRAAGIRFWMLTGDKFSTALQIATACNFKSPSSPLSVIDADTEPEVSEQVSAIRLKFLRERQREHTVIVRGASLVFAVNSPEFSEVCLSAAAVIACRVTPAQKAQLVRIVRSAKLISLAIGDGGNDVAMIQEAHVGVGIRGREGLQASRAADYSVENFKSLCPLLLVHGRLSYTRSAFVIQYSFYKSICFCLIQIQYASLSRFSGVSLFNSLCIAAYNVILFLPVLTVVMDQDIPIKVCLEYPFLYAEAANSLFFNFGTFLLTWVVRAVWHALVIFQTARLWSDETLDYDFFGQSVFLSFLWVQCLTLVLQMKYFTVWHLVIVVVCQGLSYAGLVATSLSMFFDSLNPYYVSLRVVEYQPVFFLNLLTVAVCVLPVITGYYLKRNYYATDADCLRAQHSLHPIGQRAAIHRELNKDTPNNTAPFSRLLKPKYQDSDSDDMANSLLSSSKTTLVLSQSTLGTRDTPTISFRKSVLDSPDTSDSGFYTSVASDRPQRSRQPTKEKRAASRSRTPAGSIEDVELGAAGCH